MDLGLAGRAYAVLGGTRGMGFECVNLLAEEGANIAVIARDPSAQQTQFNKLAERHGVKIRGFAGDASVAGGAEGAVAAAIECFGSLDGLAVTNHWMGESRAFLGIDDAEWDGYFQNCLMAAVRAARVALPHMAAHGGGSLVLTTAHSSRAPKPRIAAYAAFKAALNNLVKSLMKEYGPAGVRVNAVAPGAIRTGRYDNRLADLRRERPDVSIEEAEQIMLAKMGLQVALDRIGAPHEVAAMIAFLLSERAGYVTGLIANVDGGTDY